MTNFEDFNLVIENLVTYFTGSYPILALLFIIVFVLVLTARGLDIRYSSLFALPLIGFFVAIGWFGGSASGAWIVNVALLVVATVYAFAIVKIST